MNEMELGQAIGRIEGKVDLVIEKQKEHTLRLNGIDGRLRKVETKATLYGAFAGCAASILGIKFRTWLGL